MSKKETLNGERITMVMSKEHIKKINARRAKIIARGENKSFSAMVNDVLSEALG